MEDQEVLEAVRRINERLDALEALAAANIERAARSMAKRVCREEVAKLRARLALSEVESDLAILGAPKE